MSDVPSKPAASATTVPAAGGDRSLETPRVSVVVPVRNEEAFIARTLDGLLQQDYPPASFEVLVVDGQSTDQTCQIVADYARRHENVQLLHNPHRLSSAARNIGIRASTGEVVIIVDGHCELDNPRYLGNLAEAFRRSGADCVGRPQPLDISNGTSLQRAIAAARSTLLGHHPDSFIYSSEEQFVPAHSVAVAYRRTIFDQVGFFDEAFDACEDVELNHRIDQAGLKCFLSPSVLVRYHPRATLGGLFRQLVRYGRGRVRLWRKHRDTLSLKTFVPALLVLGVVGGLLVSSVSPLVALAYGVAVAFYLAVVLVTSLAVSLRLGNLPLLPWLPAVFLAIHFGAGTGILLELVQGCRGGTRGPSPEKPS